MFLHARVHKLLYPLIALLLLMQSFAVWHGAEHSFHIEDEQCERFEAFSQAPTGAVTVWTLVFVGLFFYKFKKYQSFSKPHPRDS